MSIAIPGTTIDVRDVKEGGTFIYGAEYSAFPPLAVRQAEARLVDNMCPLSYIMVGNTGKSVSRSYSRALDGLVPKHATVKTGGKNPIRSPGEQGYDDAMKYLTTVDDTTGLTPVDIYVEKQTLWAEAQDEWDKAKLKAQKDATLQHPDDTVLQRQTYDEWNQANYRKYKFAVQARWMDWVSNGHKYNVEFNFGMVDTESIMARIENSKESMRNSTIVDADGANEVYLVDLTPKNWATLCKQKQEGWFRRNGQYSLEQLDGEIQRLQRLLTSYEALEEITEGTTDDDTGGTAEDGTNDTNGTTPAANGNTPATPATPAPPATPATPATPAKAPHGFPLKDANDVRPDKNPDESALALRTAYKTLYAAEAAINSWNAKIAKSNARDDDILKQDEYKAAVTALDEARKGLDDAIVADKNDHMAWTKYMNASMQGDADTTLKKWLTATTSTIKSQLAALQRKRVDKLAQQPVKISAILDASTKEGETGTTVAADGSELADPLFGISTTSASTSTSASTPAAAAAAAAAAGSESDPWTTISCSFSAVDQSSSTKSSSWGMSVGGGAGWGLWSVGGSYAHDESKTDSQSDMASCDVSVTFDALVVNIGRPWLYAELFSDFELDVADDILLSPGASELQRMMKEQVAASKNRGDDGKGGDDAAARAAASAVVDQLAQYNSFPAFPTSFVLAANTVIDFKGSTQHIEDHFSSSSSSGSSSVGWGPFSVRSSFHSSSQSQTHQMQATATGCRLTFGAPQIIGWVNQILPALPRTYAFEPMVQSNVPSRS